jgi:4-amino-4-deoxy-L-arabinose transferase-like glycosyltransferase
MAPGRSWWREAGVAWLLVLVVTAYFTRAGALPLRGEEPTRAQIAREMVERGDWVVPREQGEPFGFRPPLQNWLIAASCLTFGSWDAWAVRFPSLLATLFTTLLVYCYSRTFLSRTGALAAAASFATLADMFQMGRQAETEALFILLVSGSLLTWHGGLLRRWPDAVTYALGYGLMALAMLTKGIQAPTYFIGSVTAYLLLTGQWRRLFCRAHLVGMLVAAAILLAWAIPYARALGWSALPTVWLGDPVVQGSAGIRSWNLRATVAHLVRYPLELAAGTLPWSLLLLLFLYRDFRQSVRATRPQALFALCCQAVAFPTCWIPPHGAPRFFAPLFPCLAVLLGLAVEHAAAAEAAGPVRAAWRRFLLAVACAMVGAALAVTGAAALAAHSPVLAPFAEPPLVVLAYALASLGLAFLTLRARTGSDPARVRTAVLALAGFLVITFTGVVTDWRVRRSEDVAEAMARLHEKLPPGQQLVSLNGHTDSLFAYHYGLPFIAPGNGSGASPTYFCVVWSGDSRPQLPFAWEEIGVVSLDRNHHPVPERVVVVGHVLPARPSSPPPVVAGSRARDPRFALGQ